MYHGKGTKRYEMSDEESIFFCFCLPGTDDGRLGRLCLLRVRGEGHGGGRNTKRDKDEDKIQDLEWMEAER
jgi:hypothetical protein